MTGHECNQTEKILDLQHNDKMIMSILEKLEKKVDEIHTFIFKWEMAKNYISREMFDLKVETLEKEMSDKLREKDNEIKEIKDTQKKVAFIIITLFIWAVASMVFIK